MSRMILEIATIVLIVYFASGAWAARRRCRALTERDYERAEQWRTECFAKAPGEDALLRSLDFALLDGDEPTKGEDLTTLVPSDDQKG
jgi:hypothetical protein